MNTVSSETITPGTMRSLCGGDAFRICDLISSSSKDAVDSFCNQFIQTVETNYYLLENVIYQKFIEMNPNHEEIIIRIILQNKFGIHTFTAENGEKGWRGKCFVLPDE